MDLILAVDALHIHKQLVVINMDIPQCVLHMEHNHVALHIHMLFAVQQDFQHITIHAAPNMLAQVAVQSIIHTMVVFAVQHMFIIHTKVELYVDNIMIVP